MQAVIITDKLSGYLSVSLATVVYHCQFITSAEEGGYVFGSVCLSVRRITRKLVNGF